MLVLACIDSFYEVLHIEYQLSEVFTLVEHRLGRGGDEAVIWANFLFRYCEDDCRQDKSDLKRLLNIYPTWHLYCHLG